MRRIPALALLALLCLQAFIWKELVLVALLVPVCILIHRGLDRTPKRADWLSHSLAWSLLLGMLGWAVFKFGLVIYFLPQMRSQADGLNLAYGLMTSLGIVGWLALTLPLLRRALTPLAPVSQSAHGSGPPSRSAPAGAPARR